MKDKNKIVRIKEIHNTNDTVERQYYEIYLTTFSEYISKTNYKGYGGNCIILLPYKWYEIQRFWNVLSFWILLKIFRNNRQRITKQIHKTTSVIVFITELCVTIKSITELIILFKS